MRVGPLDCCLVDLPRVPCRWSHHDEASLAAMSGAKALHWISAMPLRRSFSAASFQSVMPSKARV